ncbi:hypothetical protein GH714_004384 [Hevea brasiliensis]|uniref:Uncharacterized protein n=1 Tax=Hevea brasiliensis TaxID=3981 RepID=A0A6A6M7K8_HEVBR|nr:hypothetical protein GH714_004384 [Hevea brasiliensis]
MIKTLSPYSTAKTAEIMSRYRPIAPKPELPANSLGDTPSMSQKIRQSPYLRNLWPQLQARPTRTRKRGRATMSPPTIKRPRTHLFGLSSPSHVPSPARHLSLQGFAYGISQLPVPNLAGVDSKLENPVSTASDLVTLPLLPCQPSVPPVEEKDLLQQLQETLTGNIITPQPIRPVGSSISVGCISEDPSSTPPVQLPKKPEEVEQEVEFESLPAVISDSKFGGSSSKRICGEVKLHLADSKVPTSSNGFSCWVRIEWGHEGKKKAINAFCDVIRLSCESKDYLFTWRFHAHNREGSESSNTA